MLLFVGLLAIMTLIEGLAQAVAGFGHLGFAITLGACFGAAYGWLLLEPMVRAALLMCRDGDAGSLNRVRGLCEAVANGDGITLPRLYIYEDNKFDVMVTGIGMGIGAVQGDIPTWQAFFSTHPTFRARIARLY